MCLLFIILWNTGHPHSFQVGFGTRDNEIKKTVFQKTRLSHRPEIVINNKSLNANIFCNLCLILIYLLSLYRIEETLQYIIGKVLIFLGNFCSSYYKSLCHLFLQATVPIHLDENETKRHLRIYFV